MKTAAVAWKIWYSVAILTCIASAMAYKKTITAAITTAAPQLPSFNLIDCEISFDTPERQIQICENSPELFPILTNAEQLAKETCEEDFKNELWNCSNFSLLKEPLITKGDQVFQESAYVYALSIAAITHTVMKSCSNNILKNCSCEDSTEVCPSLVEHGLQIAETFLYQNYSLTDDDLKQTIVQHIFEAVRNIINETLNSAGQRCQCYGITGECSFQTCVAIIPDFSILADKIKAAYSRSCKVLPDESSQNGWRPDCGMTNVSDSDFIHTATHDWCRINPEIGAFGQSGRECELFQNAPNSCSKLCCGRKSEGVILEKEKQCHCFFEFCCEIKCKVCKYRSVCQRCT